MDNALLKKLYFREEYSPIILNMPESVKEKFAGTIYSGQEVKKRAFLLLFAHEIKEIDLFFPSVKNEIIYDAYIWIAYPKKKSNIPSDLSRDSLWKLMSSYGLDGVGLVSIDESWSAMRFRPQELKQKKTLNSI